MTRSQVVDTVAYYPSVYSNTYYSMQSIEQRGKMRGAQRVIAFCLMTAVLPVVLLIIPLYLRHNVFADVTYAVAESDVIEMKEGISSIFCQQHALKMNTTFQAFQVKGSPRLSSNRKHIRLKKSMSLPDDTLEYWGFYLLKGSTVVLSLCSRFAGSRILVVEGERNLRTCGLMEHSEKPVNAHMANGRGQVRVTFNTDAKEVLSGDRVDPAPPPARPSVSTSAPKPLPLPVPTLAPTQVPALVLEDDDDDEDDGRFEASGDEIDVEGQYEGENRSEVDEDYETLKLLQSFSEKFIKKHRLGAVKHSDNETETADLSEQVHGGRKIRHLNNRLEAMKKQVSRTASQARDARRSELEDSLGGKHRAKRSYIKEVHMLDAKVGHGHAGNVTEDGNTDESSVSSFENNLLTCYDGKILLAQPFHPSIDCSLSQIEENNHIMKTTHEVESDGYYYYIFYSDNDIEVNDIHAIFNIHKPTYQYANFTKDCMNQTECVFPISFWSDETVIVEVPTRNGIVKEDDDISFLISSCYPRMSVYAVFPIAVLFLILGCAFL